MSDHDRIHLVTGPRSGIGREVATRLIERGDRVVLLVRSEDQLDELAEALPGHDSIRVLDLADSRTVDEFDLLSGRSRLPGLDSIVHSAGVVQLGPVSGLDDRTWQRHLAVNLVAPALLTRAALPLLRARGGTVVFMNSTSGMATSAEWSAYSASKFGLRALADALRAEEPAIRVTSVFPGRTATRMQEQVHRTEGRDYDPARWIQPGTVAEEIVRVIDLPADATIPEIVIRPRG